MTASAFDILSFSMKIGKGTANILLIIGIFIALSWITRFFTFLSELRDGTMVAPAVHFTLIPLNILIAAYLIYLSFKIRRAAR